MQGGNLDINVFNSIDLNKQYHKVSQREKVRERVRERERKGERVRVRQTFQSESLNESLKEIFVSYVIFEIPKFKFLSQKEQC